jgi:FAD/FMN-containing dehydrogenase
MSLPLDALRDLVGAEHVLTSDHDLVAYSTDATPLQRALPEAVVLAGSREEIAGVLHLAEEHRFPVMPRASSTVSGSSPCNPATSRCRGRGGRCTRSSAPRTERP